MPGETIFGTIPYQLREPLVGRGWVDLKLCTLPVGKTAGAGIIGLSVAIVVFLVAAEV